MTSWCVSNSMWFVCGGLGFDPVGDRLCFDFLCGVPSIAETLDNRGIVCRVCVYRRVCFGYVVASASAVGDCRRVPSAYYGLCRIRVL